MTAREFSIHAEEYEYMKAAKGTEQTLAALLNNIGFHGDFNAIAAPDARATIKIAHPHSREPQNVQPDAEKFLALVSSIAEIPNRHSQPARLEVTNEDGGHSLVSVVRSLR